MATIDELTAMTGRKSVVIESKMETSADGKRRYYMATAEQEFGAFYMVSKKHFDDMQAVVEAARALVEDNNIFTALELLERGILGKQKQFEVLQIACMKRNTKDSRGYARFTNLNLLTKRRWSFTRPLGIG